MSEANVTPASPVRIRAEISPADPDCCRFVVSKVVHPGGPHLFSSREDTVGSDLPARLFTIAGVVSVVVSEDVVTVTKRATSEWTEMVREIGRAIREQVETGAPAIAAVSARREFGDADPEQAVAQAQAVLDKEINPSVSNHGGRITVVDIRHGLIHVQLSGGCQGCAASQLTLKQGVEVALRRAFPEINGVLDVTDHAAGARPYYRHEHGSGA